jgi:hypothetical protein
MWNVIVGELSNPVRDEKSVYLYMKNGLYISFRSDKCYY